MKKLFITILAICSFNIFSSQEAPRNQITKDELLAIIESSTQCLGKMAGKKNEYDTIVVNTREKYKNNHYKFHNHLLINLIKAATAAQSVKNQDAGWLIFDRLAHLLTILTRKKNNITTPLSVYDVKYYVDKLSDVISYSIQSIASSIGKTEIYVQEIENQVKITIDQNFSTESQTKFRVLHEFLVKKLIKVANEQFQITKVNPGFVLIDTLYNELVAWEQRHQISNSTSSSSNTQFKPFYGTPHKLN